MSGDRLVETYKEWVQVAGGELEFGRQLFNFDFPGLQPWYKTVFEGLVYYLTEDELSSAKQFAEECRISMEQLNEAMDFWKELGVWSWVDNPDGIREFFFLKSPLDVRVQLIVQIDGKTAINTTDVSEIENLTKKGRGTVRGEDQT